MKKNHNNSNDEKYKHVINLLNDLPKVKAAENFEYNLKVRIDNKNFIIGSEKNAKFSFWKILIPAGSIAAASLAFALFFFNTDSETFENPFHMQPKLRNEVLGSFSSINNIGIDGKISSTDVIIKPKSEKIVSTNSPVIVSKERQLLNKKTTTEFPFKDYKSTNIDDMLDKADNFSTADRRATLASRNNSQLFFDGFYIREEIDKKYVEMMKSRLDSLNREMKNQIKR